MLHQSAELDLMFQALADPTRRVMVERLSRGPTSVSELAQPLAMSLSAVVQHLQVLETSGLVRSEKVGRVRTARTSVGLSYCRFHLTFELNEAPLRSQPSKILDLVVGINKEAGVRVFGPAGLRACGRALELWCGPEEVTFQNR